MGFFTSMFSRFEDKLTLCVRLESGDEWRIPLIWTPAAQQEIIESFTKYATPHET
jgi:hypothetical protein